MIPEVREAYNRAYTDEQYQAFHQQLYDVIGDHATFRLSETPIFLPDELANELLDSCNRISDVIATPSGLAATTGAIRAPYWSIHGEPDRPLFLQYDFALCATDDGIRPWLIELQGFPSLYFFQADLARSFRENLPVPAGYSSFFNGFDESSYVELLREVIMGEHAPESVILLEIEPAKQNTRIDFLATANQIQLPTVSLEELERNGKKLFYRREGRIIPVTRIYNRVILDELNTKDLSKYEFTLREEVDVEWAGHPDWFLRISKHTLPAIGHLPNVPVTTFANEYVAGSWDLSKYVLKPLYSFSGAGVNLNPTEADISALERPQNWILQRKVAYGPVLQTPTGPAKCEVRMMLVWRPGEERPTVVNNLVRITKGEMTGVKYNNEATWVGASVAMHRLGKK
ncbi:MAG: hypothetical protein AB8F78_14740 [Saprospiraceae bacterium]